VLLWPWRMLIPSDLRVGKTRRHLQRPSKAHRKILQLTAGPHPLCSSHGDDWGLEPVPRLPAEIQLDRCIDGGCKG
jgi:hypothetical protein